MPPAATGATITPERRSGVWAKGRMRYKIAMIWVRIAGVVGASLLAVVMSAQLALGEPPVIPFGRGSQGHVVIPVTVNGEAGYAVLDNGAGTSVIDRGFAVGLGLISPGTKAIFNRAGGSPVRRKAVIRVGDAEEKVKAGVMDLRPLSDTSGKHIIAVVGEEFFEDRIVEIDFSTQTVIFRDRNTFAPPAGASPIALKSADSAKARISLTLEGSIVEAVLDLGASYTLAIPRGATAKRWVAEGRPWTEQFSGSVHGDQLRSSANRLMTARSVTIGGLSLTDVPADVLSQKWLVAPSGAGIGVNLLSRFDLTFDIKGKRVWMTPNETAREPFRYMVGGLSWDGLGSGEAMIHTVYRNSPAEKAGLKAGDVVVRVNGEAPTREIVTRFEPGQVVELELEDGSQRRLTAERFY